MSAYRVSDDCLAVSSKPSRTRPLKTRVVHLLLVMVIVLREDDFPISLWGRFSSCLSCYGGATPRRNKKRHRQTALHGTASSKLGRRRTYSTSVSLHPDGPIPRIARRSVV